MLVCKDADNTVRWKPGDRLNHYFEQRCDQLPSDHVAVIAEDETLTFRQLDERANQAARYLLDQGLKAGDRIALLFDKSIHSYVALLAVMKMGAAYVPLDAGFPNDRIAFILEDAEVKAILSVSQYRNKVADFTAKRVFLDGAEQEISATSTARLSADTASGSSDELCYIIYTSGTTGRPKGVAVNHASICNFVRVAAEIYGYGPGDRVYQGMTIAFDFSVEELWVPLIAGAALVPARPGASLVGEDLANFLLEKRITGFCCVPTLLATIEKDLPDLRLLLLSGEACPPHLVKRWHRPGRTILNVYGPTEATVTATLAKLHPDRQVTIGGPLPTYSIVILDAEKDALVAEGELGEIGIAGIGLAEGYLNRPDLTQAKFIADFLDIPNNPSRRIYRTGDLGRINADDEVEFHGRIDTQVKVRGYRIELTEIESLLMEFPQIAQAVVNTFEPEPGAVELVAYYSLNRDGSDLPQAEIAEKLRNRLPGYMVPAYYQQLAVIPMTTSHKADRKNLPVPTGPRISGGSSDYVAPRTGTEEILAAALAKVLKVERVSIADNFFTALGAHSLLMARFCSEIRQTANMPDVSMRDIYLHPTVRQLAENLDAAAGAVAAPRERLALRIPSDLEYYGCGVLQLSFYAGFGLLALWILVVGFEWTYAAIDNTAELYLRLVAFLIASFVVGTAIPVAAKWLLIGRWEKETFPVWSLRYFRFWAVKTLIGGSPMVVFAGTPLYNVYLRMLGAKIGRGVVIQAIGIPVATDLFSLGDNATLSKDSRILGHKAEANYIRIGGVSIGANAFVGEASVIDIDTAMEDDTQLGHASSLQSGQRVPAGQRYHGSPAIETATNYCTMEPRNCTALRRWTYTVLLGIPGFALLAPFSIMLLYWIFPYIYNNTRSPEVYILSPDSSLLLLTVEIAVISVVLFVVFLGIGLLGVFVVPRLLRRFLQEDRTYVLYGVHYYIFQFLSAASNSRFFNVLFGDSSYIVNYLTWVGWDLGKVEQTGSNFGTGQKHDHPFFCTVGTGTIVSDGLSMSNARISNTSFKLSRVAIGERNFLGNNIQFPSDARTGANVLLGTKVMVPIDGPVRENVGLLGSPPFEIPRAVEQEKQFDHYKNEHVRKERIRRKNAYNLKAMGWFLLSAWAVLYTTLLLTYIAVIHYPNHGVMPLALFGVLMSVVGVVYFTFAEWASIRFRRLQPQIVSIYDNYFWMHERYWKFYNSPLNALFKGTPFANVIARMMGVRVGRKVFDDGCHYVEKSMVRIGDYANLNAGCVLQGHSLEEGVFKSDHIVVGKGCSIGAAAFVHYGVTMGENVVLDPDSFVMKGETLEPNTVWQGNPAKAVGGRPAESDRLVRPTVKGSEKSPGVLERAA